MKVQVVNKNVIEIKKVFRKETYKEIARLWDKLLLEKNTIRLKRASSEPGHNPKNKFLLKSVKFSLNLGRYIISQRS